MRHALPLLALLALAPVASAADPKPAKPKEKDPSFAYIDSLMSTANLLAKVTDEKSAEEAKPKLDKLYAASRAARKEFLTKLADDKVSDATLEGLMGEFPKFLAVVNEKIAAEYARIGSKQKAAYKVLRETKLFAELEADADQLAVVYADVLADALKAYETVNGKPAAKLADVGEFLDDSKKALTDPWGTPFQLKYADVNGKPRAFIWTVNPHTGKKIGTPPPEEKKDKEK